MSNAQSYKFLFLCFSIWLVVCFSACEELADEPGAPKYLEKIVIDALANDRDSVFKVYLTKTRAINDTSKQQFISGAQVKLYDYDKNSEYLFTDSLETYKLQYRFKSGKKYRLSIVYQNTSYEADATVPLPIKIDSVLLEAVVNEKNMYYITFYMPKASQSQTNYYLVNYYKNHQRFYQYNLFDDQFLTYMAMPFTINGSKNDTAKVEVHVISRSFFDFYNNMTLNKENDGLMFVNNLKYNAPSNFSNGALGYFHISSMDWKEVVVR